jgi:lipopolysaccharide export system protein LptA
VLLPRHTTRKVLSLRVGRTLIYALAGLSIASAQNLAPEEDAKDPDEEESTGFLDGSLMPDGGILRNVLIPQYTRDLLLSATLRAEALTIVTQKIIDAENVRIEFFNPDRSTRGRIDMATARYNAIKQLLTSDKPVSLVSDDLTATGSSLVYDLKNTRGFLSGPVTATTLIDQSTSMNTKPVRQAIAAGSLMMAAATPLPAQQEPSAASISQRIEEARLSPYELARISKDSETAKPLAKAAADRGNTALEDATHRSEEATATLADFLSAATLTTLLAEPFVPAAATSTDVPRPNIPADPTKTRITSDDGAFFDSKNGLLIFLKNVVVRDPRFSLSGADELKVFFDPKEVPAAAKAAPKPPAGEQANLPPEPAKPEGAGAPVKEEKAGIADAKFGKPNRIIATGTVVVEYQSGKQDDPPVKASARTVIYDLKKEEFILRGGSPWVLREGQLSSVPGNDAYIVIQKDGSFVTGNGGIDAQMDIKDKTKEDDKKNR